MDEPKLTASEWAVIQQMRERGGGALDAVSSRPVYRKEPERDAQGRPQHVNQPKGEPINAAHYRPQYYEPNIKPYREVDPNALFPRNHTSTWRDAEEYAENTAYPAAKLIDEGQLTPEKMDAYLKYEFPLILQALVDITPVRDSHFNDCPISLHNFNHQLKTRSFNADPKTIRWYGTLETRPKPGSIEAWLRVGVEKWLFKLRPQAETERYEREQEKKAQAQKKNKKDDLV